MTRQNEQGRARLCAHFAELRPGTMIRMLCSWCGGEHVGILVEQGVGETVTSKGEFTIEHWLELHPRGCLSVPFGVTANCVAKRRIYIVDTGYDPAAEAEARHAGIFADRVMRVVRR